MANQRINSKKELPHQLWGLDPGFRRGFYSLLSIPGSLKGYPGSFLSSQSADPGFRWGFYSLL